MKLRIAILAACSSVLVFAVTAANAETVKLQIKNIPTGPGDDIKIDATKKNTSDRPGGGGGRPAGGAGVTTVKSSKSNTSDRMGGGGGKGSAGVGRTIGLDDPVVFNGR